MSDKERASKRASEREREIGEVDALRRLLAVARLAGVTRVEGRSDYLPVADRALQ